MEGPELNLFENQDSSINFSGLGSDIGRDLNWSPEGSPKEVTRKFVKLSENGESCFSSFVGGTPSPTKKSNSISPIKNQLRGISPIGSVTPGGVSPVKQGFTEMTAKRVPMALAKY